jgi:hypothetical protein
MLLFALHRAGVPQLATWKRDCAWLRAIAQRALVLRVALPDVLDVDTLTTECVTIQQLRVLHTLFVAPEPSLTAPLRKVVTVRVGDDATADPPAPLLLMSSDAPRKPSPGGSRTTSVRMPSSLARVPDQPLSPSARALLWLRRLRVGAVKLAAASTRVARTRLSGMLWSDERQQLLGALLAWAKLDEGSLVAEPRDNQLRWRTQHEWDALRANEARLGEKDVMEMRAYQRLSFIFSSCTLRCACMPSRVAAAWLLPAACCLLTARAPSAAARRRQMPAARIGGSPLICCRSCSSPPSVRTRGALATISPDASCFLPAQSRSSRRAPRCRSSRRASSRLQVRACLPACLPATSLLQDVNASGLTHSPALLRSAAGHPAGQTVPQRIRQPAGGAEPDQRACMRRPVSTHTHTQCPGSSHALRLHQIGARSSSSCFVDFY